MEQNKALQIVYTFFVGILLAVFVGVGINTFYPPPAEPVYPLITEPAVGETNEEQSLRQEKLEEQYRAYEEEERQPYERNVSLIAVVSAVLFVVLSIVLEKRIKIISDGVMLGGLFTLLYGILRGFAAQDSKYLFVVVSISLALVLFLGYHKFVKNSPAAKKPTKK